MNYFLKKHKLVAWIVMLTFLFSMVMPTNLGLGNAAEAAGETTRVNVPVTMFDYGQGDKPDPNGNIKNWDTEKVATLNAYADSIYTKGDTTNGDGLYFSGNTNRNGYYAGKGNENGKNRYSNGTNVYWGIASDTLVNGLPAINGSTDVGQKIFGNDNQPQTYGDGAQKRTFRTAADSTRTSLSFHYDPSTNEYSYDSSKDGTSVNGTKEFWPYGSQNYYFGMKMHLDFAMPTDGKINNTDPMVFNFSGDDDMWVYIDEKLALDIGGIHQAAAGSINFAEQRVYYDCPINNSNSKLRTEGGKKYVAFSDLGLSDFAVGGHTLDLFYLERGAGNSNCKIEFNLLTFTGNPNLMKSVTGNSAFLSDETTYTFQVLNENDAPCAGLEYEVYGGTQAVKGKLLADGKITLTAAQRAAFNVEANQKIKMVELGAGAYATHLKVEQLPKTGTPQTLQDADEQASDAVKIPDTNVAKVNYYFTNSLKEVADLTITKALEDDITDEETEFTFKVTFDTKDEACASEVKSANLVYTGDISAADGSKIDVAADGTFTLRAGETARIKDVPVNAGYKVEEILPPGSKYVCLTDEDDMTGTLTANTTVEVVNGYPTTSVSGQKIWQNDNNTWPEGETVTVGLYTESNGNYAAVLDENNNPKTATLTSATDRFNFIDLPAYNASGAINYVVKELVNGLPATTVTVGNDTYNVTDGTKTTGSDGSVNYNIINTLTGTDVTITKNWANPGNLLNAHPNSITVTLTGTAGTDTAKAITEGPYTITKAATGSVSIAKADGTALEEGTDYTANMQDNVWSVTFKNLPVANSNDVRYAYSVSENAVTGYTPSYGTTNPLAITNTPDTATLTINKVWENMGQTIPVTSLIFDIVGKVGDDVVVNTTATVRETGDWTTSIDLPTHYMGNAITYYVAEQSVPDGYEVSYKVNRTAVSANEVTWSPAEGGQRSILAALIEWITGNDTTPATKSYTLEATNTLQTAGISFTKKYSGGTETSGAVFKLFEDDKEVATLTGDANNKYSTTSGVLKYGVTYTLRETTTPTGYTTAADKTLQLVKATDGSYKVQVGTGETAVSYSLTNGIASLPDIVNTVKTAGFSFTKEYNSTAPATDPTFTVYEGTATTGGTTVSKENGLYTIFNLQYGKTYHVVESTVTNYEPVTIDLRVNSLDNDGNPLVTVTSVKVNNVEKLTDTTVWNSTTNILTNQVKRANYTLTKTYDGQSSNAIGTGAATFTVYTDAQHTTPATGVNPSQSGNDYRFSYLACGQTYYVVETAPEGYDAASFTITVSDVNGVATATAAGTGITGNVLNNTIKTVDYSFTKEYVGPTPETDATFTVTNDKDSTYSQTITIGNDGKYTMTDLKAGYTYTVTETAPTGYVPVQFTVTVGTAEGSDGKLPVTVTQVTNNPDYETKEAVNATTNVVTNYLAQQNVSVSGTKTWVGGNPEEGTEIEVSLFCDGVKTDVTTRSVNWKYSFNDLDRYDLQTGKPYVYTVEETAIVAADGTETALAESGYHAYYTPKAVGENGNVVIDITNTRDTAMVQIKGQKTWVDLTDKNRPEEVTIVLFQKGQEDEDGRITVDKAVARTTVSAAGWSFNFGAWPTVNAYGKPYTYTVKEEAVPEGYCSMVTVSDAKEGILDFTVQNTALGIIDLGTITVKKTVSGNLAPKDESYDFVLLVNAAERLKQALTDAEKAMEANLKTALADAKAAKERAAKALTDAKDGLFGGTRLTNTSASSYQFYVTEEGTATLAATTGSALYIESVNIDIETAEDSEGILDRIAGQIADVIKAFAEKLVNTEADTDNVTTETLFAEVVNNVEVATGSAIAMDKDAMRNMFNAAVQNEKAEKAYTDALAEWNMFDAAHTTPAAITLTVSYNNKTTEIELDPDSFVEGADQDHPELWAYTVTDVDGEAVNGMTVYLDMENKQYLIPFALLGGEQITFALDSTTGSSLSYEVRECDLNGLMVFTVDEQYVNTTIKLNNDAENAVVIDGKKALITTGEKNVATGSALTYEFINAYNSSVNPPGPDPDPRDPEKKEEKPPVVPIPDPEVPQGEPEIIPEEDVPLVDVPGEEVTEVVDTPVPLGDAPQMGDSSNPIAFAMALLVAGLGLVVTRRKFN